MEKELSNWAEDRIFKLKRLTKFDMAWEIDRVTPHSLIGVYVDAYKRDEIVKIFNSTFGTNIN